MAKKTNTENANFTNKPVDPSEVPEDILKKVENMGDDELDELGNFFDGCKNTVTMDELEARAFGEDDTDEGKVNKFVDRLFFATRAIKTVKFYKALFRKLGDWFDDERFLDGFRAGAYFILICFYIGAAIKAAKDKKGNA